MENCKAKDIRKVELRLVGVVAKDTGYGLEIEGYGDLATLISRLLGTRDEDNNRANYSGNPLNTELRPFNSNNCDITVMIVDTPSSDIVSINDGVAKSVNNALRGLEDTYKEAKDELEKNAKADTQE